jgi:hypothetical protein
VCCGHQVKGLYAKDGDSNTPKTKLADKVDAFDWYEGGRGR